MGSSGGFDVAALRAMAQRVVHQHAGEHRLGDRRRANAHAGVVAAVVFTVVGSPLRFDRAARNADAGSGLERDAHQDSWPVEMPPSVPPRCSRENPGG